MQLSFEREKCQSVRHSVWHHTSQVQKKKGEKLPKWTIPWIFSTNIQKEAVIYLFLMIIFLHLILADSALLDGRWFIYLCFPSLWASPSVLMLGLPTPDSSYSVVQWVRDSVNVHNSNQDRTGIINSSSCLLCPISHPFLPPSFFPSFSFFIRNSSVILVWVFKSCTWSWDILICFMYFIFHVHSHESYIISQTSVVIQMLVWCTFITSVLINIHLLFLTAGVKS